MVDGEIGYGFRRRQPHIDRDTGPARGARAQTAPGQHAGTGRAEQDFERRRILACARIAVNRSRDADALIDEVIGPQRAIAAAERAVAGGDRTRIAFQGPVGCAAMAGSRQHLASFAAVFDLSPVAIVPALCTVCKPPNVLAFAPAFLQ